MSSAGYACKQCGAVVSMTTDGALLRSCGHTATVVAAMSATAVRGAGGLTVGTSPRLRRAVDWMLALLRTRPKAG